MLFLCCMVAAALLLPSWGMAEPAKISAPLDTKRLEGRWQRPDGGYILELHETKRDGSLQATYYNPRPIRVGKVELLSKGNRLTVVVELRDVNYPGSRYDLRLEPASDRLVGTYYQAVEKATYPVEFVRIR